MRVIAATLILSVFACAFAQEMIRQCMCNEVDGCKERAKNAAPQCIESCKGKLSAVGDPEAIKQCVKDKQDKMMEVKECVMSKIGRVCATQPNQMVPKQDLEALKSEAENEAQDRFANSPLRNSPLFQGMHEVMGTLKEFGSCMKQCMHEEVHNCITSLGCGIDMPPKEELQAAVQLCVGSNGPAEMQDTCNCFANKGGVTQLASICPLMSAMGAMNGGGGMGGGGMLGRLRG